MYSKPNFLIIGTQKSGTESHTTHLNQHSNVYMYEGECHFFDRGDYQPDYDEYHEFFKDVENEIAIGEKTPSYMYFRFAIDNIYEYNPNIKLIISLREPISRAYSQYCMDKKNGVNVFNSGDIYFSDDEDSFLDSVRSTEHLKVKDIKSNGYWGLQRGFYIDQVEYILSKFDRKNVLILISEKVLKNPLREYNKVFNFLGVSSLDNKIFNFYDGINKTEYSKKIKKEDYSYLYEIYKSYNDRLYDFLECRIEEWEYK
jgi:hypothetical protein|tara:strand:- start:1193 stop:1963 length:771 start_codon:yes stop_codon:yes gene_type:complete